ncbi:MAG: DUF2304 domain-containing protein [Pseudomonadota bacterium]
MTPRQTVMMVIVALAFLTLVLQLVRVRRLSERYSLLWIVIALAMATLPWMYDVYIGIAGLTGIYEPPSFFFFFSIMGLTLIALQLSASASTARKQRKLLAQEVALLEKRISDLVLDLTLNGLFFSDYLGPA